MANRNCSNLVGFERKIMRRGKISLQTHDAQKLRLRAIIKISFLFIVIETIISRPNGYISFLPMSMRATIYL